MKNLKLLRIYEAIVFLFFTLSMVIYILSAVNNNTTPATSLLALVSVLSTIVSIIFVSSFVKKYKYMKNLIIASKELSMGNLDVDIDYDYNKKDEYNQLAINLTLIRDSLGRTITDIENLSILHERGYIDERVDHTYYSGNFKSVIEKTNSMVESYASIVNELVSSITNIAEGNFDFKVKQFTGKKAIITERILLLQSNLFGINNEIDNLTKGAIHGELGSRATTENFQGDWKVLLEELNELLEVVIKPINESREVLQQISAGNFNVKVEGDYQGDFLIIKTAMNDMIKNVSSYIHEISDVLNSISNGDLAVSIKNEYVGEYANIKEALNQIIYNLNDVIGGINIASNNVQDASNSINRDTKQIADGARHQNVIVDQLVSSVDIIHIKADENVKNVTSAEKASKSLSESAEKGSKQMDSMMKSMESINQSSNEISNIIKVVEDIAFQTKLLSLNASVEAARAGVHGRGFAIVAEEVRVLALKSEDAVKTTSELIKNSSSKIVEGSETATETDLALKDILAKVSDVYKYMGKINESSLEQKDIISSINSLIIDIKNVVNSNTEITEDSERQTESLLIEARELKEKVSQFNLK